MNALAGEKSIIKAIKRCVKNVFLKIFHGIQNGNDVGLDTAGPKISKFRASGQDPSFSSALGQGSSRVAGESGSVK